MKTIVFHSYKGGLGRTLALVNFALALEAMGKKVLLLDLDFNSPGLYSKIVNCCYTDGIVGSGYLDYLLTFKAIERQCENKIDLRSDYFKSIDLFRDSDRKLHLISAGNCLTADYWKNISSQYFHQLFYF